MALIGTSLVVEGNTAPITTSPSKTSTAGSLVVGGHASYRGDSIATVSNLTSSLSGTYTKAGDVAVSNVGDRVGYGLTYNIGGTRTSGHTLSIASTPTTTSSKSGSWQEFDSIDPAPTVTAGTAASGTSNTPSCQVTIPSGNATVLAVMIYLGASATATVTNGTEISKADENSDHQDLFVAGKFGQTGTVTITWQFGAAASRFWSCRAYAFTEAAGGGGTRGLFCVPPVSGIGIGGSFFRDPLQSAPRGMVRRDRIFVPERFAA